MIFRYNITIYIIIIIVSSYDLKLFIFNERFLLAVFNLLPQRRSQVRHDLCRSFCQFCQNIDQNIYVDHFVSCQKIFKASHPFIISCLCLILSLVLSRLRVQKLSSVHLYVLSWKIILGIVIVANLWCGCNKFSVSLVISSTLPRTLSPFDQVGSSHKNQ